MQNRSLSEFRRLFKQVPERFQIKVLSRGTPVSVGSKCGCCCLYESARADMRTYGLVALARICARQSHVTTSALVAAELWLAKEYLEKAAQLDEGKMSVIGEDPKFLSRLGGV